MLRLDRNAELKRKCGYSNCSINSDSFFRHLPHAHPPQKKMLVLVVMTAVTMTTTNDSDDGGDDKSLLLGTPFTSVQLQDNP